MTLTTTHCVSIAAGKIVPEPITISNLVPAGQATIEKLIIKIGAGSHVIIHDHANDVDFHSVNEIILEIAPHAYVELLGNYDAPLNKSLRRHIQVLINEFAKFEYNGIVAGDGTSNVNITMVMNGTSSHAHVAIASLSHGDGFCSIETIQNHRGNHSASTVVVKQLATERSRVNYKSLIEILPSAKQVTAHQKHKALLLSAQAQAHANPQLNVQHNKEVHCSHGSAISQLDELLIWYATTRGIAIERAQFLLIEGFFTDLCNINTFKNALKTQLTNFLEE